MRLNVLFVTAWYPTSVHPTAGIFVREHARAAAPFVDLRVLHVPCEDPDPSGRAIWRERDEDLTAGIATYRIGARTVRPRTTRVGYLQRIVSFGRALAARGYLPDLVHAHVHRAARPAAVLARILDCPFIVTEHSSAFPRHLLAPRDLRRVRRAMSAARLVLPVSQVLQRSLEEHGIPGPFRVVPNTVDTTLFAPGAEPPRPPLRLLAVGALEPVKGLDVLLRAVAQIDGSVAADLAVVGSGSQLDALSQLARDLGVSDRVTFHGVLPKREVAQHMRSSHLLALPSRWDNMPCVALEALTSGLPIVASRVGGIPEIVGRDDGALVPPDDDAALAAAISANSRRTFDRAAIARRAAARYDLEPVGRMLNDVYREIVGVGAA